MKDLNGNSTTRTDSSRSIWMQSESSLANAIPTQNAINHKLQNVTGMQEAPLIQQITILHVSDIALNNRMQCGDRRDTRWLALNMHVFTCVVLHGV